MDRNDREVMKRIADHIEILNHNSTSMKDNIQEMSQTLKEMKESFDKNVWKLVWVLVGAIGALVGVRFIV